MATASIWGEATVHSNKRRWEIQLRVRVGRGDALLLISITMVSRTFLLQTAMRRNKPCASMNLSFGCTIFMWIDQWVTSQLPNIIRANLPGRAGRGGPM